ncbi:MAG: hypothetical protein QHH07_06720 [Sedimentisphaerales bacterium]|nr:hypothetical protein [Sedimentisphaerales bacterium]
MVRDCDKLDIYRIVLPLYEGTAGDGLLDLGVRLPDEPRCNPTLVAALREGRRVNADQIQTLSDLKLMQLGWVYDINFLHSLQLLAADRYLERLADTIPDTDGVRPAKEAVFRYLHSRLEAQEGQAVNPR